MDWKKYDSLTTAQNIRTSIREDKTLTKEKYNATKIFSDDTWNISEFIKSELLVRSAFVARCMLFGKTEKGEDDRNALGSNRPLADSMSVRIQVLSRQGCTKDADGNPINVRPKELDACTEHTDKPVPGDVVVVRQGMKEINDEEKALSGAERNRMIMSGKSVYHEIEYVVDNDLCIDVTIQDAFTLLSKAGHRIVQPEFKQRLPHLNRDEKKFERRISNWLYKEVPLDFTVPVENNYNGKEKNRNNRTK